MKRFIFILCIFFVACAPVSNQGSIVDKTKAKELIDIGVIHLRQRNFNKAKAAFKVSYELDASPAALDGLGCIATLENDYKNAQRYFLDAYALDSDYSYALGNLAFLYQVMGNEKASSQLYQKALHANPDNFRARNNLAGLLAESYNESEYSKNELLKASVVAEHPIVVRNLKRVEK